MRLAQSAAVAIFFGTCATSLMGQGKAPKALSADQIVERVSPSAVAILAGKGDGEVAAVGCGVIVRNDGVILTANHVVKGMREVQVRLKSGEVYDDVELIAADERRDVAALRIPATRLAVMPMGSSATAGSGATVFVVSKPAGSRWTGFSGVLSAMRVADKVPGAGRGYRILQFTASLSAGSSGGILVDAEARLLGIIVDSLSVSQDVNFAVPIESVAGLGNASGGTRFESGVRLQPLDAPEEASQAASESNTAEAEKLAAEKADADNVLGSFKSYYIKSDTIYLHRETLQKELRNRREFSAWELTETDDANSADVAITITLPLLSWEWNYRMVYQPTGAVLGTGKVSAAVEKTAAPQLAALIVKRIREARPLPASFQGAGEKQEPLAN